MPMGTSDAFASSLLLSVYFLSLATASRATAAAHDADDHHQPLRQCLVTSHYSHPSHPISSILHTPDNSSYSSVLRAYVRNLRFTDENSFTRRPFLIVAALHESHVQATVLCARQLGVHMKIRSGGHDYEGLSYVSHIDSSFFVLDMFNLRSTDININDDTAWVQAGATLGELFYRISEKSKTRGFPAGICPTVGVGGHFTAGGYGPLMRKYGLSVDNIVDARLVDVNGQLLDRKSMGEDLFWAIRGGGAASFGVVVSYKIRLLPVPNNVTVFRVERTMEADDALDIVVEWQEVAYKLVDDLFIRLTMDVVNGTKKEKIVRATFRALYLGDSRRLLSIMGERIPSMGVVQSDCHEMNWVDSVVFWYDFALGTPADVLLSRTPPSLAYLKRKSDYLNKPISRDDLEQIWEKMIELEAPYLAFNAYGGRMDEISESETPFPHRAGNLYKIQYVMNWHEGGSKAAERYIDLTRQLYTYMTPFVSRYPREAYFNYRDIDLGVNYQGKWSYYEARRYGVKYFKDNFERLVRIKTNVDPTNFFRNEQSIPVLPHTLIINGGKFDGNPM